MAIQSIKKLEDYSPSPAGANSQIQYNNNGVLGASSNMTWDGSRLDVTGEMRASTGILFGADTAAVNRLDDYEEGTFTPTLNDTGSTTFSYDYQTGGYTRIGKMVSIYWSCGGGHDNNSPNSLQIILPFTASNDNPASRFPRFETTWMNITLPAGGVNLSAYINPGTTIGNILVLYESANSWTGIPTSALATSNFQLTWTGVYWV